MLITKNIFTCDQILCGKKRTASLRSDSTTIEFHPINLESLNSTEKSFYLASIIDLKLRKSSGKLSQTSFSLNTDNPYDPEIDSNTKYCICKTVWDQQANMIQCDGKCNDWYHQKCLNLSDEEFSKIVNGGTWICPLCKADQN